MSLNNYSPGCDPSRVARLAHGFPAATTAQAYTVSRGQTVQGVSNYLVAPSDSFLAEKVATV